MGDMGVAAPSNGNAVPISILCICPSRSRAPRSAPPPRPK